MEISGLFSALVVGVLVGLLGRAVLPGRQRIGFWRTLFVGIGAALLGSLIATVIGVAHTTGVDWIELALQIGIAAAGVSVLDQATLRPTRGH